MTDYVRRPQDFCSEKLSCSHSYQSKSWLIFNNVRSHKAQRRSCICVVVNITTPCPLSAVEVSWLETLIPVLLEVALVFSANEGSL